MRLMSLLSLSFVLIGALAHAQVADLGGGNPPPLGQDPSDMPPPPVPPGPGGSTQPSQPTDPVPPVDIPQNDPYRPGPYDPNDQPWLPAPQLPQISAAVLQQACGLSMRGSIELRFGEQLFKSADFRLQLRIQQKISDNAYRVMAVTIAGASNSVVENDTGSGTCTYDMYGRQTLNLRFNKRGTFDIVSDSSLQQVAPRSMTFSGKADSSIGHRAIRLQAF